MATTNPASKKQLTVFVTVTVAPESIPAFKAAHQPVWAACAKEPQCLFFDVFQDPEKIGRFRFVEVWSESREWFETEQMTKPYYAEMWPKSKPLWTEEAVLEFYERDDSGVGIYRQPFLAEATKMD